MPDVSWLTPSRLGCRSPAERKTPQAVHGSAGHPVPPRTDATDAHRAGLVVLGSRPPDLDQQPVRTESLDEPLTPLDHGHGLVEGGVEVEVVDLDRRAK